MAWVVVLVAAIPALYALYVAWTAVRLIVEVKRLRRAAAVRGLSLTWGFMTLDLEDPVVANVVLERDRRQFHLSIIRSLLPSWTFGTLRIEPLLLAKRLERDVYFDRVAGVSSSYSTHLLSKGWVELLAVDLPEIDARYRLCAEKSVAPDAVELLRAVLARPEVRARLLACEGDFVFRGTSASVRRGERETPFLDWLDSIASLADALDDAVKTVAGPYR